MATTDPLTPLTDEVLRRIQLALSVQLNETKQKIETELRQKLQAEADKLNVVGAKTIEVSLIELNKKRIIKLGKQHKKFETVLNHLKINLPAFIYGPTGSGKTEGLIRVGEALGFSNGDIVVKPCHPQESASALLGYMTPNKEYVPGAAFKPYTEGGLLIIDELDNGSPAINLCLNALTSSQAFFPCGVRKKHPRFFMAATANTLGTGATIQYVGRNSQDKALLNRFVNVKWDYDLAFEHELAWSEYSNYGGIDKEEFYGHLKAFWRTRLACDDLSINHILSTRNLIYLMRQVAAKIELEEITRSTVLRGIDKDQGVKIVNRAKDILLTEEMKQLIPAKNEQVVGWDLAQTTAEVESENCPI